MFRNKLCYLKKKPFHCETARIREVCTMETEINALEFSAVEKKIFFSYCATNNKTNLFCHSLGRDVRPVYK